jgi:hypothetical protein
VERPLVATKIVESLGSRLDRWSVEAARALDRRGFVTLSHRRVPVSCRNRCAIDETEAATVAMHMLGPSTEIDVASAAPDLEHADLISGIRTIAQMFEWESREVRAVAFLMFEHGHLNNDETAWLSGYDGIGAPMKAASPLA